MTDKRDLEDHEHIDQGLKAAFGEPSGSVLERLESISGTRSRILLRDAPEDASPLLRVPGPGEEGAATDDSRYQIIGEIARGGVGVVYKGRDKDLGRDVALKVLRAEFAKDDPVIQRFVEEAQVGAQLQHPGIVPIYGLGLQADGKPYFAMKLIKGVTLTALIEQGEKTSTLIGVFERIAQTVAYAHSRGVIHRDLKPSNVMVGAFGEAQVVDWGFAKVLGREETAPRPDVTLVATVRTGAEGSQSLMGSVMGTPAYMSPEQAMGDVDALTERSDVFALGAILCEIMTREPPYTGTMQDRLLAAAQGRLDEAYARLSDCRAPDPLKELARDCMAPLPKDRPRDAGEVARRLADHLASVEERARQAELDAVQAAAETRKAERSKRTTVALAAVVLIALLGGGIGYSAWSRSERERIETTSAKVTPLLREATRLEGLGEWSEATATAAAALSLAQIGGADEDTLRSARALHVRVGDKAQMAAVRGAKAAREHALLDTLDEVVLRIDELTAAQAEQARLAAFRTFGVDLDSENATAALRDIRRSAVLAVHLDLWAFARRGRKDGFSARLDRIARAIDDDAWRNQLRDAMRITDAAKRLTALRSLSAAAEVDNQHVASLTWLAWALGATGDPEAAVAVLHRARVRHPGDFWVHSHLATLLWVRLRRATPALAHARAALALRPNSIGAWNVLGSILNDGKEDYPAAERAFRRALQIDPTIASVNTNLGNALSGKGDLDGALAAYREAIRLDPNLANAHHGLGDVLRGKGDLDGALAACREAIRIDPKIAIHHSNLGDLLRGKGDFDGALAACHEAIRLDPRYAPAHNNLGCVLREMGDLDGALAACREAIRVDPKIAAFHNNLGVALRDKDDIDGALAAYREAIRIDPMYAEVHTNLGSALLGKGDLDGAIAAYREAIRIDPNYANAHYNLGVALRDKGDRDGAIAAYREAIRVDPNNAHAHENLGYALREKGDLDGAIAAYRAAIRIDPNSANAHSSLGNVLRGKGDLDGALAACREAIRLDPRYAPAHGNLGGVLREKGDLDGAIAACREAIRIDPKLSNAHNNLGAALHDKGDIDGAMAAVREAIRIDPNHANAHNNLGSALLGKGDLDGAIAAYREAIRIDPKLGPAHKNLGTCLQTRGDIDGAMAAFREAIRIDPKHEAAHSTYNNLGACLLGKGDNDGAVAAFREVIRLDPRSASAHSNLGAALADKGDTDGAIAACREAIRLDPNLAIAHNNLGNTLQIKGDTDGAIAACREAIRLDPKLAIAHDNLARSLRRKGDTDGAISACREAIRLDPKNAGYHSQLGGWLWEDGDFKDAAAALRAAVALGADHQDALARAEAFAAAQTRFPAFLAGTYRPATAEESLDFAVVCHLAKEYATSVRIYDEAFRKEPALASDLRAGHRYNAACAAVRAGREWHGRALAWLRADLDAKNELPKESSWMVAHWMRHWLGDADLTSVRDADDLSEEWKQFWADVAALLERVSK